MQHCSTESFSFPKEEGNMFYRNMKIWDWACANAHIHMTVHNPCNEANVSTKDENNFNVIPEALKFLKLLPETTDTTELY